MDFEKFQDNIHHLAERVLTLENNIAQLELTLSSKRIQPQDLPHTIEDICINVICKGTDVELLFLQRYITDEIYRRLVHGTR